MAPYQHPASLNVLQQFHQANAIFKKTSRAKNPAWYQDALSLDFQLHIRVDGASVTSFFFDRSQNHWSPGPNLAEDFLLDPEKIRSFAAELLQHVRSLSAASLGVVLHIADEFTLAELKQDFDDPVMMADLRQTVIDNPASALDDTSRDFTQNTWRAIPYLGNAHGQIGTTISVTHQYKPFLDALRSLGETENFPIVTQALSAPLVALLGIPGTVTRNADRPFVVILQYPSLTILALFNQHADLISLRTQQHRGLRRPPNFRQTVLTTCTSLEIVDPDLFIFPLGREVDSALPTDLGTTFPNSHLELVKIRDPKGLPPWAVEPLIATSPSFEEHPPGITFDTLRNEGWSFQNFLPPSKEDAEVFPTRGEIRLLGAFYYARFALLALVVASIGWLAFSFSRMLLNSEVFFFQPSEAAALQKRIGILNADLRKTGHIENLLEDRSKAWAAMELLARLFPPDSGAIVKSHTHTVRPQNTPSQGKVGFVKEWKISGTAREEALDYLATLNSREGIAARFSEIAGATGNTAYNPDVPSRTLVVNVSIRENNAPRPSISGRDDSHAFPYTFDLTITQRFEATDPLALTVSKTP